MSGFLASRATLQDAFSKKETLTMSSCCFDEVAAVGAQQGGRWEEASLLKVQVVLSSHNLMSSGATGGSRGTGWD